MLAHVRARQFSRCAKAAQGNLRRAHLNRQRRSAPPGSPMAPVLNVPPPPPARRPPAATFQPAPLLCPEAAVIRPGMPANCCQNRTWSTGRRCQAGRRGNRRRQMISLPSAGRQCPANHRGDRRQSHPAWTDRQCGGRWHLRRSVGRPRHGGPA
jgi:hypothetical protein